MSEDLNQDLIESEGDNGIDWRYPTVDVVDLLNGGSNLPDDTDNTVDTEFTEIKECQLEAFTKKGAIRNKDQKQSSNSSKWFYYNCDKCEKWHVETTGELRSGYKKKTTK
jgi:hypothetical protein